MLLLHRQKDAQILDRLWGQNWTVNIRLVTSPPVRAAFLFFFPLRALVAPSSDSFVPPRIAELCALACFALFTTLRTILVPYTIDYTILYYTLI